MDLKAPTLGFYVRIIAIVSLLLGLNDAARVLGVASGPESPIALLGGMGFTYIAIFAMARLFAAVGLWIRSSWGAVLLIGATVIELGLFLSGSHDVQISPIGFGIRLVLLVAILFVFAFTFRFNRERAGD
jgi:hypothetical protein